MKINVSRFLWALLVVAYFINFFYNLFWDLGNPFPFISFVSMALILLWLGTEYYFHALFFQSNLVKNLHPLLRAAFATFFYLFIILSIYDMGWVLKTRFPIPIEILGFLLIAAGIYIRVEVLIHDKKKIFSSNFYKWVKHPRYTGMILIVIGIPLAMNSLLALLLVPAGIIIILVEVLYEDKILAFNNIKPQFYILPWIK